MLLNGCIGVLAGPLLLSLVSAYPMQRAASIANNDKTSLTLLYQNNLNASDDVNHVGAIVLDPMSQTAAVAACQSIGESLISQDTLQQHQEDFARALSYQAYAGRALPVQNYHIDNGILVVAENVDRLVFLTTTLGPVELPVLCTQSSNDNTPSAPATPSNEIVIASGGNQYVGFRNKKSFRFLGIPYADPPQRWQYSTLYSSKGQTISATAYGSQCAQVEEGSENCLFLNIQTPYIPKAGSTKGLRPVLFWIHGGGFTGGTGAAPGTDGGDLASREDIVVVTINYRLSTLGFLAIPGTDIRGNFGIADQILALEVSTSVYLCMWHRR
jgi:hypothetical protein